MTHSAGFINLLPHSASTTPFQSLPPVESSAGNQVPALYVHVPFCTTKCHYCDFFSVAGHLQEARRYLDALAAESTLIRRHFARQNVDTIFIGGGTPTLLEPPLLRAMLEITTSTVAMSCVTEFTVEANPNTFDNRRAEVLAAAGVNRISFGAQSFVPAELTALQRDHLPENVSKAIAAARGAGISNYNIDLIFGIPGQTLESWNYSLNQALALEPRHLSCYSLIYEPNTALAARLNRGEVTRCAEDLEMEMFELVYAKLRAAGFERYEVSNYALPEKRCRHNMHYWGGDNYLAMGPAASGHFNGYRWKNVSGLNRYIDALAVSSPQLPQAPITEMEHLQGLPRWGELAMLQLRLKDGLIWSIFQQRTNFDARPVLAGLIKKYAGTGLIEVDSQHLALTDAGVRVSDRLFSETLAAFAACQC